MRVPSQSRRSIVEPKRAQSVTPANEQCDRPVPWICARTSSTSSIWIVVNWWQRWKSEWTSHRIPFYKNTQCKMKEWWVKTGRNGTITRGVLRRYKSTETLPIDPQLVAIVSYSHLLFLLKGIRLMNKRAVNQTASSTAHHTLYIYNVIFYINK